MNREALLRLSEKRILEYLALHPRGSRPSVLVQKLQKKGLDIPSAWIRLLAVGSVRLNANLKLVLTK